MATPAAVSEQTGSSSFTKQPGPGPKKGPGCPGSGVASVSKSKGLALMAVPPGTQIRSGAQVSFSLGLSSVSNFQSSWGVSVLPKLAELVTWEQGQDPSTPTSRPRLFKITGEWRTAPGPGCSPWPSFCSQSPGAPPPPPAVLSSITAATWIIFTFLFRCMWWRRPGAPAQPEMVSVLLTVHHTSTVLGTRYVLRDSCWASALWVNESVRIDSFHPISHSLRLKPFPHFLLSSVARSRVGAGYQEGRCGLFPRGAAFRQMRVQTQQWSAVSARWRLSRGCRSWGWRLQEARRQDRRSTGGLPEWGHSQTKSQECPGAGWAKKNVSVRRNSKSKGRVVWSSLLCAGHPMKLAIGREYRAWQRGPGYSWRGRARGRTPWARLRSSKPKWPCAAV